jgi:hypothetical protein
MQRKGITDKTEERPSQTKQRKDIMKEQEKASWRKQRRGITEKNRREASQERHCKRNRGETPQR